MPCHSDYAEYRQDGLDIYGDYNTVYGKRCRIYGDYNIVIGDECDVNGDYNQIRGRNCTFKGDYNQVSGANASGRGDFNQLSHRTSQARGDFNQHTRSTYRDASPIRSHTIISNSSVRNASIGTHTNVWTMGENDSSNAASIESIASAENADVIDGEDTPLADEDSEEKGCVICLTNVKCCILLPCAHLCLCLACARQSERRCPLCREHCTRIQRVYT